jgi:hypothetical protein
MVSAKSITAPRRVFNSFNQARGLTQSAKKTQALGNVAAVSPNIIFGDAGVERQELNHIGGSQVG